MLKKTLYSLLVALLSIMLGACGTEKQTDGNTTQQETEESTHIENTEEETSRPSESTSHENMEEDDSLNETDANGNTIIRNEEDGTVTVIDKDGYMVQVILTEKDGTIVTQNYDRNGNLVSEDRITPGISDTTEPDKTESDKTESDKTESEENGDNGKPAYPQYAGQTIVVTDDIGRTWNTTYDENGYEVASYCEYQDEFGNWWRDVKEYHADGSSDTNTCHYLNGVWEPRTLYHKNGVLAKTVGVSSHGLTISYFDENGRPTETYSVDNHNNPTHIVYNTDGSFVCYTTEKDGSITTTYYDANGNEIHP